jgi:hypothetical protein
MGLDGYLFPNQDLDTKKSSRSSCESYPTGAAGAASRGRHASRPYRLTHTKPWRLRLSEVGGGQQVGAGPLRGTGRPRGTLVSLVVGTRHGLEAYF